jgi:hypothetical protein
MQTYNPQIHKRMSVGATLVVAKNQNHMFAQNQNNVDNQNDNHHKKGQPQGLPLPKPKRYVCPKLKQH